MNQQFLIMFQLDQQLQEEIFGPVTSVFDFEDEETSD